MTGPEDDDLFAGLEGVGRRLSTHVEKVEPQRSVGYAGCPKCLNDKVGLVRQGSHLAFKDHYVATWGGAARQCGAGGRRLCDLPARDVTAHTGLSTPVCICTDRI